MILFSSHVFVSWPFIPSLDFTEEVILKMNSSAANEMSSLFVSEFGILVLEPASLLAHWHLLDSSFTLRKPSNPGR